MYRILLCILFPLSLFGTVKPDLQRCLQSGNYELVYDEASASLQRCDLPALQIESLFNRALSLFFLDDFLAAYEDLSEIEEIASSVSTLEFTSKEFREIFTEFAWFRLGLAAANKNQQDMFRCLEVLKIIDDSFPDIFIYDNCVKVFPKTNFQKISSFVEMLVGLNAISNKGQVSYDNESILITYPDSFFIPKPLNYLKKIEVAAGRCFCSSYWADVSWEFIGKSINSSCIWTYFSFGDWHHELLKKIEKSGD